MGTNQVMPEISAAEYNRLKKQIEQRGVLVPVAIDEDGNIIDGHHRVKICQELGIDYKTEVIPGLSEQEKRSTARMLNIARRHLGNKGKRIVITEELVETGGKFSDRIYAEALGVSHPTVRSVLRELVESGQLENFSSSMGADGKRRPRGKTARRFNYQTNDRIDYAKWSWNPITGCLHPCAYCTSRDTAARRFGDKEFRPTFHSERLEAPLNTKIPKGREDEPGIRNVFLGIMTDMFGDFIEKEWLDQVFGMVKRSPAWNFLILTKNPKRIVEFQPFPENVWIGATVDRQERVKPTEEAFEGIEATVKFLSCEPLLKPLRFSKLELFDWVAIGGQSRTSKVPEFQPEFDWVVSLIGQAKEAGCMVYCKPNLRPVFPKEYPIHGNR